MGTRGTMRYRTGHIAMDRHPEPLLAAAREMSRCLATRQFAAPVRTVYAPLDYAWCGYRAYVESWAPRHAAVLFLGMNPGPFGMAQTGVPFGEVGAARDWLGLDCAVRTPAAEHPKRPIQGFACPRSEISGARLWGLFRDRFGTPEAFFRDHFVVNYCPLMFVEASGRNRTPDKLPAAERTPLLALCDRHLLAVVEHLRPRWLIGIGAFAMRAAQRAVRPLPDRRRPRSVQILHPSPASPAANRGWTQAATAALIDASIWD